MTGPFHGNVCPDLQGKNMKVRFLAKKLYCDRRVRFLFVGCLNTAVGTGSDLFLRYLGLHYALSGALGTMIGTIHSYFWNKYFTYSQKKKSWREAGRFVLVYAAVYALGVLFQYFLIDRGGTDKYLAGILSAFVTTLVSYFGHTYFTFRQKREKAGEEREKKMEIRVADYIADFFVKNGITDIFSVPGGGAMHLNDALGHKEGLRVIYNHHEQACAFAAEGYVRATGRLPAVCVTTGPGGTNAVTGVMGSWVDSVPMFVVSGQVKFSVTVASCPEIPLRQLGDQEFNILDCVRCMTKYCAMVVDPRTILYHLEKALYIARHGRPGPVWLDIPLDVQAAKIRVSELTGYDEAEDKAQLPPKPDTAQLEELLSRIAAARRPVILAGEAIRMTGTADKLEKLAEKLKIPVVTAWNAHDLLPDDNPCYCGRPGTVGTRGGNIVVQSSDLLLSLGCRMNLRQISFNYENFAKNAFLAAVDIDRAELDKPTLHVDMKIHADIREVLDELLALPYLGGRHADWLAHSRAMNEKYPAVLPEYYRKKSPVNPYVFVYELSRLLPEGQVTVTGNGSACVCSFQAMVIRKGQRLFTNSGSAAMGYGLPAAIGAAFACRGKDVVCLEGDGSVQMNLQELQTVVHHRLPLKLFWLNNDGYHSMRQTQSNLFGGRFSGVDEQSGISFPSAEKIALAYGIPYFLIDNTETMGEILGKVLHAEGPVLCEAVLDKTQFFAPKLSSRVFPDGRIISPSLEDMYPFLPAEELKEDMEG